MLFPIVDGYNTCVSVKIDDIFEAINNDEIVGVVVAIIELPIYNDEIFNIFESIDKDDSQTLPINEPALEGYHGSTNGIEFNNERLFLVHRNKERTYHRWILFNPSTQALRASEPFVFFKHSHIEFTCSLASFKDRIFVSIGVNDNSAFILELDRNEIGQYI